MRIGTIETIAIILLAIMILYSYYLLLDVYTYVNELTEIINEHVPDSSLIEEVEVLSDRIRNLKMGEKIIDTQEKTIKLKDRENKLLEQKLKNLTEQYLELIDEE